VFNVGPMELLVLCVVGLIVVGPEKLPNLARDAARMIKTLRELATGARTQLREELGPEFADIDLRNLNPKTAVSRMLLGDGTDTINPVKLVRESLDDEDLRAAPDFAPVPNPIRAAQPVPAEPPSGTVERARGETPPAATNYDDAT